VPASKQINWALPLAATRYAERFDSSKPPFTPSGMTLKLFDEMDALFDCPATCTAIINKIATIGPNFGFKS
jgi:hypothetical protein